MWFSVHNLPHYCFIPELIHSVSTTTSVGITSESSHHFSLSSLRSPSASEPFYVPIFRKKVFCQKGPLLYLLHYLLSVHSPRLQLWYNFSTFNQQNLSIIHCVSYCLAFQLQLHSCYLTLSFLISFVSLPQFCSGPSCLQPTHSRLLILHSLPGKPLSCNKIHCPHSRTWHSAPEENKPQFLTPAFRAFYICSMLPIHVYLKPSKKIKF